MAKNMVIVRQAQILEMHENTYKDNKTNEMKDFHQVFLFQRSSASGDKPVLIEARVHSEEVIPMLRKNEGKVMDLCLEMSTYKSGTYYEYFSTLDEFIKGSVPNLAPVSKAQGE